MASNQINHICFISEYLNCEIKLSIQCYYLRKIESEEVQNILYKDSRRFNTSRYQIERFYKIIDIPININKYNFENGI